MNYPDWADAIRDVADFPKPGILFKDITPLLADADGLRAAIRAMAAPWRDAGVQAVLGVEARGFILGAALARELDAGFVPVRKPGKLPGATLRQAYGLEYGNDCVEVCVDAIAAIAARKPAASASSGVMSLNRMPGLGKSATSRIAPAQSG